MHEEDAENEKHTDLVTIKSLHLYSIRSVIVTKLTTSKSKMANLRNKIDTGNDGILMQLNVFKILFPRVTIWQLEKYERQKCHTKIYNKSSTSWVGLCSNTINHKNKQKLCKFFVVPGNVPTLLGMPHIKLLDILTIKCIIKWSNVTN